tara:strand:- start:305 stop:535 length:231 start_codon:yes stop_codon:yes gene_type:complete
MADEGQARKRKRGNKKKKGEPSPAKKYVEKEENLSDGETVDDEAVDDEEEVDLYLLLNVEKTASKVTHGVAHKQIV